VIAMVFSKDVLSLVSVFGCPCRSVGYRRDKNFQMIVQEALRQDWPRVILRDFFRAIHLRALVRGLASAGHSPDQVVGFCGLRHFGLIGLVDNLIGGPEVLLSPSLKITLTNRTLGRLRLPE